MLGNCKDLNLDFLLFDNQRGGDLMEVHIRKEPPQEGLVLEPGKIGFDLGIFTKKMPTNYSVSHIDQKKKLTTVSKRTNSSHF